MALAEFLHARRTYGDFVALAGLDLEVRRGEVLGLIGPNGAGKTTTLRLLCGLLDPSSGTVRIDGRDVAAEPVAAKSRLAFVPEGAPLYPNLSPRAHLGLIGRLHGLGEREIATEGLRLLGALDLAERVDDPVGTFSRGMRQKVAVACALLPRPPLLVLDEPLSGLDAPSAAMLKAVLRGWAERGGAVLYTSHLLDVVERVCHRVAILARGELVAAGTLEELRATAGAGDATLEQVFSTLAHGEDPGASALALLGDATPRP